jgi:hypothetical protein
VNDVNCPGGYCEFERKPDGGPASAGPVAVTVSAEGFRSQSLTVDVPASAALNDPCCGYYPPWTGQMEVVYLERL